MFTDSSGTTQLSQPIILGVGGYAQCGGPGSACIPFINSTLVYTIVIQNSAGSTLYTFTGISASGGGGGGGGTNYWSLSGSAISNTNGAGAGNVQVGANFTAAGNLIVQGSGGLQLVSSTGDFAAIAATPGMPSSVTWYWPTADSTGVGCLSSNGSAQLSFIACGGGGGGGSPGGTTYSVQSNYPLGTLYGDANLTYACPGPTSPASCANPQLTLAGVFEVVGNHNGFDAPTCTNINCIQAPEGGVLATTFTWQGEGSPPTGNAGFGAMAYTPDVHSGCPPTCIYNVKLGNGTSSFYPVAMSDIWENFTSSDCVQVTVTSGVPYFTDAGAACGASGGSGTVSGSAQYNVGYYTAASSMGTTVGGANSFAFNPGASPVPQLSIAGTIEATLTGGTGGFVSEGTAYNTIQAPLGGMYTAQFALKQLTSLATSGAGATWIYADNAGMPTSTGGAGLHASVGGNAYVNIATTVGTLISGDCVRSNAFGNFVDAGAPCGTGGGGLGTSVDTDVIYNHGGSIVSDSNLRWLYSTQQFVITGTGSSPYYNDEALDVVNGYAQIDGGVVASSTSYQAWNDGSGGVYANSLYAKAYTGTGTYSGASPTLTAGQTGFTNGTMAWSSTNNCETVYNGSAFVCLGLAGVNSLNALTGALTLQGTANEITVTVGGGCPTSIICLTTPQGIAPGNAPTFSAVTATNGFGAGATGTGTTFGNSNGNFTVNGNGAVSIAGVLASSSGVNVATTVNPYSIQTSGGINACNAGGCTGGQAISISGSTVATSNGFWIGGLSTPLAGSNVVYIGPAGNFYARALSSSGITCTGINDGWLAVSNDDYVVVCLGGARFRASLVAY